MKTKARPAPPGKASVDTVFIGDVLATVRDIAATIRTVANSSVERERIRAEAEEEIQNIHYARDALLTYLDKSFDERRVNFERLFGIVDKALDSGQLDAVAKGLDAIVDLAAQSPFKALADGATAVRVLKEKGHDWEL